jgi:hypothetical protein
MNRRDIKNKNKIGDTDTGTDNELQPLQGFSEGFNNGLNNKFGEFIEAKSLTAHSSARSLATLKSNATLDNTLQK